MTFGSGIRVEISGFDSRELGVRNAGGKARLCLDNARWSHYSKRPTGGLCETWCGSVEVQRPRWGCGGHQLNAIKKCGDQKVHFAEGQTTARGADTASAMDFRSDSELVRR